MSTFRKAIVHERVIKYGFRDDTAIRVTYTVGQHEDDHGKTFSFVELDDVFDETTGEKLETTQAENQWIEAKIENQERIDYDDWKLDQAIERARDRELDQMDRAEARNWGGLDYP